MPLCRRPLQKCKKRAARPRMPPRTSFRPTRRCGAPGSHRMSPSSSRRSCTDTKAFALHNTIGPCGPARGGVGASNRAAILGGTMPDVLVDIFPDFSAPLKSGVNAFVDYLVVTHGNTFEAFSNSILTVLVWLEAI